MGLFAHHAEDDVQVSASFPDTNPFGLVVNGERNPLSITLQNLGKKNYTLVSASASYHDPLRNWALVKNSTTLKYNVPLVSGANFSAPFTMHSEYRPQELGLTVWVNLAEPGSKDIHPVTAFNQTVNIVEPASSWFDPQAIFMYLLLTTALAGGIYYAYNSYFAPPAKKATKPKKVKAVVVADQKAYPDVRPYEEEWIPAEHLKSRQPKLKKRGGASSGGEDLTSGGEITSGGETSGAEIRKSKSKKKGKKA